jgi:UDP:flavonoid glycosyltransferase YjiC (YdhE family)
MLRRSLRAPFAAEQLQPDNARRVVEFQVARSIHWKKFNSQQAARNLENIFQSSCVRENCQRLDSLFPMGNRLGETCEVIEEFANRFQRISPVPAKQAATMLPIQ